MIVLPRAALGPVVGPSHRPAFRVAAATLAPAASINSSARAPVMAKTAIAATPLSRNLFIAPFLPS